jgi:hypothetical protein
MTESDKLTFCLNCTNKKWTASQGIVCQLTEKKPFFEDSCFSYELDQAAFSDFRNSIIARTNSDEDETITPKIYELKKKQTPQTLYVKDNKLIGIYFLLFPMILLIIGLFSSIKEGFEPLIFLITIPPVFALAYYGFYKLKNREVWLILDKKKGLIVTAKKYIKETCIPWNKINIALIKSSQTYGGPSIDELLIYQLGKKEPISIRIVSSNLNYQSLVDKIEYCRQENVR